MHIFITGIAGFLGSNLADYYVKKGFKVSGNDTLIGGDIKNLNSEVNFYKYDCENLILNNKYFKNVDVIIHSAAYAHEGLSVFSPYLITKNIVSGSVAVFSAAVQQKVKRIVYCSSMARYGGIKQPYLESSIPRPQDPYGIAKLAAERILINMSETFGFEYNIAIPHNIIGPKQKYDDPFRNVVSIMINRMLQGKAPIIYGDGNQTRCFSYIDDCLSCLIPMLDQKNLNRETINIGPDEEFVTINKIAELCSNITGVNLNPIYKKDRPKEVKHATCSANKARKLLNYKTKVSLADGIKNTFDYIKTRGTRPFDYNINIEISNDLTPSTWKNKEI